MHKSEQSGNEISTDLHFRAGLTADAKIVSDLILLFAKDFCINSDGSGAEVFHQSVSEAAERTYLADSRYHFILAIQGGMLAGFIAMRDLGHLFHFFVNPAFQRQRLATALWQRAHRYATTQGHGTSFTVNSSINAIPVYEGFGFKAKGPIMAMHGITFFPMQFN